MVLFFIFNYRALGDHKLVGLIYVYDGSSASGINLEMLKKIAGTTVMRNLVIAAPPATYLPFQLFLAYGAQVIEYNNQLRSSAENIIQAVSKKSNEFKSGLLLQIQREVVHSQKPVADTTAGLQVQAFLMERIQEMVKQLKDLCDKKDHPSQGQIKRKVELKTAILEYQIALIKQSGKFGAFKDFSDGV